MCYCYYIKIEELEAKVEDLQMLKFGQLIDLEKIENVEVNKAAEELREKIHSEERRKARELRQIRESYQAAKDDLITVTKTNTACLQRYAELTQEKNRMTRTLNIIEQDGLVSSAMENCN